MVQKAAPGQADIVKGRAEAEPSVRHPGHAVHTVAEDPPERAGIAGAGKATTQADDGHRLPVMRGYPIGRRRGWTRPRVARPVHHGGDGWLIVDQRLGHAPAQPCFELAGERDCLQRAEPVRCERLTDIDLLWGDAHSPGDLAAHPSFDGLGRVFRLRGGVACILQRRLPRGDGLQLAAQISLAARAPLNLPAAGLGHSGRFEQGDGVHVQFVLFRHAPAYRAEDLFGHDAPADFAPEFHRHHQPLLEAGIQREGRRRTRVQGRMGLLNGGLNILGIEVAPSDDDQVL